MAATPTAECDPSRYVIPARYWGWLGSPPVVRGLLWLVTLAVAGSSLYKAWHWFDDPATAPEEQRRADGNHGHCQIDFGGQWVMGRMIVLGHGRELYHRQRQWEVVRAGFPPEFEAPAPRAGTVRPGPAPARPHTRPDEVVRHDADALMNWFMGSDPEEWKTAGGAVACGLAPGPVSGPLSAVACQLAAKHAVTPELVATLDRPAVGGPLYPPLHGFLYAPLGAIDRPQTAYRVMQLIATAMVFVAGWGVTFLSQGRIPWSVATLVLFLFPGTQGGLDLGQNPTVSLALVVWGWALASRGYDAAGGAVWGLFAFKPVWGLAFFLVPLLTRRWRFAAAMVLTGGGLVAATLPFVGLTTWFDWLEVGKEAAGLYNVNQNWILLSRDVQGIPRRVLHDFSVPESQRDSRLARSIAWGLWAAILVATAVLYLRHGDRRQATGVGAAFVFFGAFLTCYRFMYYDTLLAAAGCAVLFADIAPFLRTRTFSLDTPAATFPPSRVLPPPSGPAAFLGPRTVGYVSSFPLSVLALLVIYQIFLSGLDIAATVAFGRLARVTTADDGSTGYTTPKLEGDTGLNYPWDTALVFLLWVWCGVRLALGNATAAENAGQPLKPETTATR
jgi:arabinofuranan 3-O-arabinosyltransferase